MPFLRNFLAVSSIPSYPSYCAGTDGRIYRNDRPIAQRQKKNLYYIVTLSQDGKIYTLHVHRLVCESWNGQCPDGMECRHLNNDRTDNRPGNLEWTTKKENEADKLKFG